MMADLEISEHKVVTFTYAIMDSKGKVIEQNDVPMDYIHGVDQRVFPDVVAALEGAHIGDTLEVELIPERGFGIYDEAKTFRDKIENVPPEFQKIGAEATFQNEDGEQLVMTVKSIKNGKIFLDGNHPFAGKTVVFKILVKDIREATDEEITTGMVQQYPSDDSKLH